MKKLLIISGPTATGKTALSVSLARRFDGELVSADSRQIYTGLDILSGKDIPFGSLPRVRKTVSYRNKPYALVTHNIDDVPVWLYDLVSPDQPCSISLYRTLAQTAIDDIASRTKLPIMVGGAGLYITSVIDTPQTIDIPPDIKRRVLLDGLPIEALQRELCLLCPERLSSMNHSDQHNPRRLIRAIEIARWQNAHPGPKAESYRFDILWIGLQRPAKELSVRIRERVCARWKNGAVDEVRRLESLSGRLPAASTLGIMPITEYLAGRCSKTEAQDMWVKQELAYAKRQMTWFRAKPGIHWYDAGNDDILQKVEKLVSEWYT